MTNKDEGVIKYQLKLKKTGRIQQKDFLDIEKWRVILFRIKLIGEYAEEKIGYGNLSKRMGNTKEFIITGSQTGKYAHLSDMQYTRVIKCDIEKGQIEAVGPIHPSSEAITHYAIYNHCPQVNYVFHVHNKNIWSHIIDNKMDFTPENISYGTTEMATAVGQLIHSKDFGIFAMKGHEDGVIAYGQTAEQAGRLILDILKNISNY